MAQFMHNTNEMNNMNIEQSNSLSLPFMVIESSETVFNKVAFTFTLTNDHFAKNEFDITSYLY